jgi:hypothetical protein
MKTILGLLASLLVAPSTQLSYEMHRNLAADDNLQESLFTPDKTGVVQTKFTIPPVSIRNVF